MTTDNGGWTLLSVGGSCSAITQQEGILSSDVCSYMNVDNVNAIAQTSNEVMLTLGSSIHNRSETVYSTNSIPIQQLQYPNRDWMGVGATWSGWSWVYWTTGPCARYAGYDGNNPSTDTSAGGWPNMFHGCGQGSTVHWLFASTAGFLHQKTASAALAETLRM